MNLSILFHFVWLVAAPQEIVVLNGTPAIRCSSSIQETGNESLSPEDRVKNRVTITKKDGKYFWTTRENRELLHRVSGGFHYFIEPGGAGYVKVMVQDRKVLFMEHVSIVFMTVTYWGEAERFNP